MRLVPLTPTGSDADSSVGEIEPGLLPLLIELPLPALATSVAPARLLSAVGILVADVHAAAIASKNAAQLKDEKHVLRSRSRIENFIPTQYPSVVDC